MAPTSGFEVPPLPIGITVGQVYADYFRYIFRHTRAFFEDWIIHGQEIWRSLVPSMHIVLAHPNGWGTREQGVLRTSAVAAGMSTLANSSRQITFVSEAEASALAELNRQNGMNLVVCDAGGSTVDTTVYNVARTQPMLELKEIKGSACIQAGGIFVDHAAEAYLRQRFKACADVEDYTMNGLESFASQTKPSFKGTEDTFDIEIGGRRVNLPAMGVRGGHMKLNLSAVKSFFDICVERIVESVSAQSSKVDTPYFFLVGGFGDNPYLRSVIKSRFGASNRLIVSNIPGVKAVADGAAMWAVARSVVSRATRYSYGIEVNRDFDENDPDHRGREKIFSPSGIHKVAGGWSQIVAKDTVLDCDSNIEEPYFMQYYTFAEVPSTQYVTLYETSSPSTSKFMCDKHGMTYPDWTAVCQVSATFQDLKGILPFNLAGRNSRPM
ncbi:hypothetical protein FRC06_002420 [Ceratobasidium sp. 370]|nr:hypothetical protein FRC06_002420 [Ceratobasidium sp. 370]